MTEKIHKELLLQAANECLMFSQDALNGYIEHSNKVVSMQFINLAAQSIKPVQTLFLQNDESHLIPEFKDFYHQFNQFSREFLWSVEGTHDIHHPKNFLIELDNLFYRLKSLLGT